MRRRLKADGKISKAKYARDYNLSGLVTIFGGGFWFLVRQWTISARIAKALRTMSQNLTTHRQTSHLEYSSAPVLSARWIVGALQVYSKPSLQGPALQGAWRYSLYLKLGFNPQPGPSAGVGPRSFMV